MAFFCTNKAVKLLNFLSSSKRSELSSVKKVRSRHRFDSKMCGVDFQARRPVLLFTVKNDSPGDLDFIFILLLLPVVGEFS